MKKHSLIITILLLFIVNITVYAEEIPTITINGVYDYLGENEETGESILESVEKDNDTYYHMSGISFRVPYTIDSINENYCLLRETSGGNNAEYVNVNCDYEQEPSEPDYFDACDHCFIRYSMVKKSEYEVLAEKYSDQAWIYTTLDKYNIVNINIKNSNYYDVNSLSLSVKDIKDENGQTINKTSGKYVLNPEVKNYSIRLKLSQVLDNMNYNYYYQVHEIDKYGNNTGSYESGDEITPDGDILTIPLNIEQITTGKFQFYINVQINNSNGYSKSIDTKTLEFELEGRKNINVSLGYKNSDKNIEYKNSEFIIMSENYNETNPLLINIDLDNYGSDDINGIIQFRECIFNTELENDVCTKKYEKSIYLIKDRTNTIEINDFVPEISSGSEKTYDILINVAGDLYNYKYLYTSGEVHSLLMSSNNMFIPSTVNDSNNMSHKGYSYKLDTDGYAYLLYKGSNLENKTYKYKFENKITKNDNTTTTIYSEREINGKDLMDNLFVFKLKTNNNEKNLVGFYLYDSNNKLISHDELSIFDESEKNLNDNISISGNGVDTKEIETGYEIYVNKDNYSNLKLRFSNSNYDNDNYFNYVVLSNEKLIKDGYISAQDLKNGISVDLNNLDTNEDYYPITLRIVGSSYTHEYSLRLRLVSNSEFNKIQQKTHFDLSSTAFNNLANRLNDNELAFVNSNGENITKQVSYVVNYYKDNELLETNTIVKNIDYFENKIVIDEDVADNNKYLGYKIKETSQTKYNSATNEYYLEPISDGGTLNIYYELDPSQVKKVSYKVEYYKDNELAETETFTKSIHVLENRLTVSKETINTTNKYIGYKYLKSNYEELPDDIEIDGVIKIYYEKKEVYYTVEYYYNGTIDNTLTKRIKGLYLETIDSYEDNLRVGYKLGNTTNYPLILSDKEEDNVIKINYIIDIDNLQEVSVNNPKVSKGDNNSLIITWDKDEYATGYKVLVSESKTGKYKELITTTDNKYTHTGLTYGKKYYYKITAYNLLYKSTSKIVSKKVVPNIVTNLKITSASTNNVKLSWDKISATGYTIERSGSNGKWVVVANVKKNTLTYKNTGLKANTMYYYRIKAYKTVNGKKVYGAYNEVVNTKTAPLKTTVKVSLKDYDSLKVKFTSVKGTKYYEIYRSTSKDGKYTKIIELDKAGTYKDPELTTGKTYYYKIKTCNSLDRCSGYTKPIGLKVVPKTPGIKLKSTTTKKVTISLSTVNGIDGFRVYRATSRYGKYKLIKDVKIDEDLTFNNKTKKYKYYYYKVRAYKIVNGKKVYSAYSPIKYIRSK